MTNCVRCGGTFNAGDRVVDVRIVRSAVNGRVYSTEPTSPREYAHADACTLDRKNESSGR
jgi:hypothetical protein